MFTPASKAQVRLTERVTDLKPIGANGIRPIFSFVSLLQTRTQEWANAIGPYIKISLSRYSLSHRSRSFEARLLRPAEV